MLQNALTKLKASEYTGGSNKSFTFRSVRTRITDKECNMEQSAAPQDEATNINHCNYQPGIRLQNGTLYITMVKGIDVVRDNVTLEHVGSVIVKNVDWGCKLFCDFGVDRVLEGHCLLPTAENSRLYRREIFR
eukprot:XP_001610571.1 hypothetical protein [Babesia bovis T2Bo]